MIPFAIFLVAGSVFNNDYLFYLSWNRYNIPISLLGCPELVLSTFSLPRREAYPCASSVAGVDYMAFKIL